MKEETGKMKTKEGCPVRGNMPKFILQMALTIVGGSVIYLSLSGVWTLEVRGAVDLSILCCMSACKHMEIAIGSLASGNCAVKMQVQHHEGF